MLFIHEYGFSSTVTIVLARDLSYLIDADMFSGIMTVSFLSPKRYILDAFVSSMSASVFACDSAFSVLDMKDGELL
jgi:hypothetical protein